MKCYRKSLWNLEVLLLSIFLCSHSVLADCVSFEPEQHLSQIPILIEGKVLSSNNDSGELNSCATNTDCTYTAKVEVRRILKGQLTQRHLHFTYTYWTGCPGVDTFLTGESRYFFLNQDGTLYSKSCGFGSSPLQGDTADFIRKRYDK